MRLWFARNKDNKLFAYDQEPISVPSIGCFVRQDGAMYPISNKLYKELTFENSPIQIEMTIV